MQKRVMSDKATQVSFPSCVGHFDEQCVRDSMPRGQRSRFQDSHANRHLNEEDPTAAWPLSFRAAACQTARVRSARYPSGVGKMSIGWVQTLWPTNS